MPYAHQKFPLGDTVPDLRGYSLAASMRMAFSFSGKSDDEIAAAMGWTKSTANRIFHNQDYWPSLPTLPRLCGVLSNMVIPRWILDNTDFLVGQIKPTDVPTLFSQLRQMMREVSELMEEGEKAMQDGKIVSLEARRILRELSDLFSVGGNMIAGLQAVIQSERDQNRP